MRGVEFEAGDVMKPEELIEKYLLGQATEEDVGRLNRLMAEDEKLRKTYRLRVSMDTGLREESHRSEGGGQSTVGGKEDPKLVWGVLAIAAVVALMFLASRNNSYPEPAVTGSYQIVGSGRLERESTFYTNEEPAVLNLGGYCRVTVEPGSQVVIEGTVENESIKLDKGSVLSAVDAGQGKFQVVTELGTVSADGGKFEVLLQEPDMNDTKTNRMLVKVLAGTALVTATTGLVTTLEAGQTTIFGNLADPFTEGGYKLVWADEFDKDGLPNPANWNFEEGFVRNNEAQYYEKDNAACKDGFLVIKGEEDIKRNPTYVKGSTGQNETKFIEFTSASIQTKGLHSWTMGRFVMRAKIPHGEGMWPAFWTVGDHGQWPDNGEIDIMEYYQDKILANVASGTQRPWNAKWSSNKVGTEELGGKAWLDQFHIWRMDWDKESIRLYVDDRLLNETKLADTYNATTKWGPKNPFHHPQYIIINLALGGDNGGDMEKAKLPAEYVIDYVRVYQTEADQQFKAEDTYVSPPPYKGKKVGIHHFSELPKTVNKKCSWEAPGADSRCYAWKAPGSSRESAKMEADFEDKLEGQVAYKFVLNHAWSRWILEMDPNYGSGVADFSPFTQMGFAIKSKDAANWEDFRVIIESKEGNSYEADLDTLGFKPDGHWHRCIIDLEKVKASGVDLTQIKTLFAIGWEGGVSNGQYYKLDDLYLE